MADALAVVGDRYSLLIVREIGYGYVRFGDMAAFTGAPRDVLSSRLKRLEEVGVLERRQYSERPPRFEYHLTEAGSALRPIVLALKEWGDTQVNARRRAGGLRAQLRAGVPPDDRLQGLWGARRGRRARGQRRDPPSQRRSLVTA